jgi:hypothetical protein
MWQRLVILGLLQAFHLERWSAAGREDIIENCDSFERLHKIGTRNDRTFRLFLSFAMRNFRNWAVAQESQSQVIPIPRTVGEIDWNSEEGKEFRTRGIHAGEVVKRRFCVCCGKRTTMQCNLCKVSLCEKMREQNEDVMNGIQCTSKISCWQLFHLKDYITKTPQRRRKRERDAMSDIEDTED